ncbi:MAG: HEPN domain-containing protein [Blastocatellia bacterium]|nr:HEPN domain-containing protein [Blastocatellia bacterium]
MLTRKELLDIIQARIDDADALYAAGRYDGAIYLCGYAVELALKRRICITLRWSGFPSTPAEFKHYESLKTHTLDILLSLSGYEKRIKRNSLAAWSDVGSWDPEARYKPVGKASSADAKKVIDSAKILIGRL